VAEAMECLRRLAGKLGVGVWSEGRFFGFGSIECVCGGEVEKEGVEVVEW